MKCRNAPALVLLLLVAPAATAQHKENFERGFAPEKMYQFANLDHANLFNGNLTITIPIGDAYALGGGSSYSITLAYNSRVWEINEVTPISPSNPPCCQPWAFPSRRSSAGLGWTLSLGRWLPIYDTKNTIEKYAFESPDGNDHALDVSADNGTTDLLSSDGSYLRWHQAAQALDFPDGSKRTFWPTGSLKRMTDASGNYVDVQETYDGSGYPSLWHITDSVGRSHKVHFKQFAGTTTFSASQTNYKFVVDRVELQTAGGIVTYKLVYANEAGVVDQPSTVKESCYGGAQGYPHQYALPLLRRIELPDGSSYSAMTYVTSDQALSSCNEGVLTGMTLPTKGHLRWGYQSWTFPRDECVQQSWFHTSTGIMTRQFLDADGTTNLGTWTYSNALDDHETVGCADDSRGGTMQAPQSVVTTVISPTGNKERHWFSGWTPGVDSSNGISSGEYGHPQSRVHKDSSNARYLASQSYDCTTGTCPAVPTRQRFVRYVTKGAVQDPVTRAITRPGDGNRFPRTEAESTVYLDGTLSYQERSDFDGYGQYRKSVAGGTFPGTNTITTYTNYNPGSGPDGKRNGSPAFASGDPWVLRTYDERWTSENGNTAKALACFESSTGFLKRLRLVRASVPSSAADPGSVAFGSDDSITVYTKGSGGNVTKEEHYGGFVRTGMTPLGTSNDLCALALPETAEYTLQHTYSNGVLATSQYYDDGTAMPFFSLDRTIHPSGIMTSERDVAGVGTAYGYDSNGRLDSVTPAGLAATNYGYANSSYTSSTGDFTPAKVSVTRSDVSSRVEYDALGRVHKEFRTVPGAGEVSRATEYDLEGRRQSVTEWGTTNTTTWTYDAFGRPTKIVAPDGSETTYEYTGARQLSRSTPVATSATGTTSTVTKEHFDAHGRVVKIEEDVANTSATTTKGGVVTTVYTYGVGGRVAAVSMTDGSTTQPRSFEYDGRGFLKREYGVETGETIYEEHDARGHASKRTVGGRTLKFEYDRAERLTTVSEVVGSDSIELKRFDFGVANRGTNDSNKLLGRLEKAIRHNHLPTAGTIDVTESYDYDTPSGQMSKRTTLVEHVEGTTRTEIQKFVHGMNYDVIGLPYTLTMPTCELHGCTTATTGNGTSTVTNNRTNGFLTGITSFGSMAYQPSGMVKTVTHSSTPTATDTYDAVNGLARPSKITFGGGVECPTITPSTISAPDATCASSAGNQASVAARTGIVHTWSVSEGGTITSGTTGNAITFTAPPSGVVTLRVTATDVSCGAMAESTKTVAIETAPTPPAINAPSSVCGGSAGHAASVAASGATHTWTIAGGNITSSATGDTITFSAGGSGSVTLTVTASRCGGTAQASATISITPLPTATVTGSTIVRDQGQIATVRVDLTGAAPWSLKWRDMSQEIIAQTSPVFREISPAPSSTTTYWLDTVSSAGCTATVNSSGTITVLPPPPTIVQATTRESDTRVVDVAWSAVGGVTAYLIERTTIRDGAAAFSTFVSSVSTNYVDTAPATSQPVTYIYYVRSVDSETSPRGAFDFATAGTTLYQQQIVAGQSILRASDLNELRKGVDAFRAAFGVTPAFASDLATGGVVRASHFTDVVAAFNFGRAVGGYAAFAYAGVPAPATGGTILRAHVVQLRDALR